MKMELLPLLILYARVCKPWESGPLEKDGVVGGTHDTQVG